MSRLRFGELSISAQLSALALCLAIPGLLAWGLHLRSEWTSAIREAYFRSQALAENYATDLGGIFRDYEALLSETVDRLEAVQLTNCAAEVKAFANLHRELTAVTVRDKQGAVVCSSLEAPAARPSERVTMAFDKANETIGLSVMWVLPGSTTGRWVVALTYPVRNDQEGVIGTFIASVDASVLNRRLFPRPPEAGVSIIDKNFNVVLRSEEFEQWVGKPIPKEAATMFAQGQQGTFRTRDMSGIDRIGAYVTVPRSGWIVGLGYAESEILGPLRQAFLRSAFFGLLASVLLGLLVWRLAERIARPIRKLSEAGHEVAVGNLSSRTSISGPKEVRQVARQFNAMLDALQSRNKERVELSRQIDSLLRSSPDVVLLFDLNGRIAESSDTASATYGYTPAELSAMTEEQLRAPGAEPIRTTADARETVQYEDVHRRKDGTTFPIEISSRVVELEGVRYRQCLGRDVTERKLRERELKEYAARVERMFSSTVETISTMVELRDPYTAGHQRRVGQIAVGIAAEMGLDAKSQDGLAFASAVHDVGKIAVPVEILSKPSSLTEAEIDLIKTHAEKGYQILQTIESPWPIAQVAREHHERLDGSGYPQGLRGEQICLEARIVAVADVIDSMGSRRPYRTGLGIAAALAEIEKNRGRLYDVEVVDACLRLFRSRSFRLPTEDDQPRTLRSRTERAA